MSAASFISMAGIIAFAGNGYGGSVYLMGWTGGYVLLALLLAPYLRKFGKYTIPDFVGDRYIETARLVAVVARHRRLLHLRRGADGGVGLVFTRFLEVDTTTGVVIGMAIVFFYAVLGGMKGITWTQVAQYCVLIVAYLIPAVAVSAKVTGIADPADRLRHDPGRARRAPGRPRPPGVHRRLRLARTCSTCCSSRRR